MIPALSRPTGHPVDGIAPFRGWVLCEQPGGVRGPREFYAQRGDEVRYLNVSRFRFTPTQARFNWLVLHSFPATWSDDGGPLTDREIDCGILQDDLSGGPRRAAMHTALLCNAIATGAL